MCILETQYRGMSGAQTEETKPTEAASTQAQAQAQAQATERTEPRSLLMSFSNMLGIGQMTNRTFDAQRPQAQARQTAAANAARRFGI